MATTLLIDHGLAAIRAVLLRGDDVAKLSVLPTYDATPRPLPGERSTAQLTDINRAAGTVFVSLPNGQAGFASYNPSWATLSKGAYVEVTIKSQARRHKNAVVEFVRRIDGKASADREKPDLLTSILSDMGLVSLDPIENIITTQGLTKAHLIASAKDTAMPPISVSAGAFYKIGFDDHLDGALTPSVSLPGGGAITIDEAEALTAIDVDTYLAKHQSRHALRETVNKQALAMISKQIELRRLGGQIVIDFLPTAKPARAAFHALVCKTLTAIEGFARPGWTPSGLFTFILPRTRASLLEAMTLPNSHYGDGRVLTPKVASALALSALEDHMRAHPQVSFGLSVGDAIWRDWQAKESTPNESLATDLATKYTNRFSVTHDPTLIETGYVCSQR